MNLRYYHYVSVTNNQSDCAVLSKAEDRMNGEINLGGR